MKKLFIIMLVSLLCLAGAGHVLAVETYSTLSEYKEKTGETIIVWNEAPELKVKVAAGELEPIEDRIPEEPMVIKPLDSVGKYGGTLRTGTTGPDIWGFDEETARWEKVIEFTSELNSLIPNIVKGWEFSDDKKAFTLYLRKGMKWSDGEAFTADDFMFWYEDVLLNNELTPVKPKEWSPGGELVEFEKVDNYTIKMKFAVSFPPILSFFAINIKAGIPFLPAHYLKKYHIKYNSEADKIAKEEGYDEWYLCFAYHALDDNNWQDVNRPNLQPWTLNKIDNAGNKYFIRNPYYWKVDTAGNQLPYISELNKLLVENTEVLDLKIISGEYDISGRNLPLANYTLYKNGEDKGGYHAFLSPGARSSECAVLLNQTVKDLVKRELFQNVRFKQAMSLAINRDEMNDLLFYGKGVPRQETITPNCSFYEDWMGKYFADYDPERANELLDELGLTKRDTEGYRKMSDGRTLSILVETGPWEMYPKVAELIADYWRNVGVKAANKTINSDLARERVWSNDSEAQLQGFDVSEFKAFGEPAKLIPPWVRSAVPWYQWHSSNGKEGMEPPSEIKRLFEVVEEWRQTEPGTDEYMELGKEMLTINLKGLYVIGTVGLAPLPFIINKNLKNTPKEGAILAWEYYFWPPYQPSQWYFDEQE